MRVSKKTETFVGTGEFDLPGSGRREEIAERDETDTNGSGSDVDQGRCPRFG